MESDGEGGFPRGSRDGIDRAQKVVNSPLGNSHKRERGILNEKVLSEPNVKVVFHQTAVPVTPLSTWIIYPKRSALGHSTRCLAEAWLSEVDSLFCSRCRTCCSVGGRSSYMDPFLSVVASAFPGRAGILYLLEKGRQSPKEGCYPHRPSSAFLVFDEKQIEISISESVFLTPPHPPPFVEPFL